VPGRRREGPGLIDSRCLTPAEIALCASVFGETVDYGAVRLYRRRWWVFQTRNTVMAPNGHIHFHPQSRLWSADFAREPLDRQGLFIHEMTHVWQTQTKGYFYLPLMRHPFCRYRYRLAAKRRFEHYGIEQQAEIVRHFFLLDRGSRPAGAAPFERYRALLPFGA
jgi:hypothetical protein